MSTEHEYNLLLDELLRGVDLADAMARKQAYSRCIEYAQNELANDPDKNRFMTLASRRLGQTRVHFRVVEGMVQMPEEARLHLIYTENAAPCLTGNPDGLRYLSDLAAALSSAPSPHEHVHLYSSEPPMFGDSEELTIYNEPDSWFDQYAITTDDADENENTNDTGEPPREIMADSIAAIEFFENSPLPPPLLLSFDKLYRVLSYKPYGNEDVWAKANIQGGSERAFIFSIRDDSGELFEIALHLDDADIRYYTHQNLEQLIPQIDGP